MDLTEQEVKVYEWLKNTLGLPVYGDVFHGAATLMKQQPIGYINFVSHAGRDIMNGLARTHRGETRSQAQYNQIVEEKIKPIWNPIGIPKEEDEKPEDNTYRIEKKARDAIDHLLKEHNEGTKRSTSADESFFQTFLKIESGEAASLQLLKRWESAKKGFMKMTHISSKPHKEGAEINLKEYYGSLLMFLDQAASKYYQQITSLHDILEDTNQPTN